MRYISLWNDISISNSNINNKYGLNVCNNKYISHFLAKKNLVKVVTKWDFTFQDDSAVNIQRHRNNLRARETMLSSNHLTNIPWRRPVVS